MAKLHVEFGEADGGTFEAIGSVVELFSLITFALWKISRESNIPFQEFVDDFATMVGSCDTAMLEEFETKKE